MISLDTVEHDISELECRDTSYANCQRLAVLYIVRDHLRGYNVSPEATMALTASSDFLQTVNGKNTQAVMEAMDDLLAALQSIHPRMYEQFMDQVRQI